MSDNDMVLSLGLGAQVAPGRYGNALLLAPLDPPLDVPPAEEKPGEFGLARLPPPEGRTVEPLSWFTAHYAALMTSGENHLRRQVGHKNPTTNALNLGDFDWTVEFWHSSGDAPAATTSEADAQDEAVIFELGAGPRGENDLVTQLSWSADRSHFVLVNQPAGAAVEIPTSTAAATAPATAPTAAVWRHYAFTYDATASQLRHYLDGALQPLPPPTAIQALPSGEEAYLTLATDGLFARPLTGLLDEFRVSRGLVYTGDFNPPPTFATQPDPVELTQGPPLLFGDDASEPLHLGTRKHLFIDDALLAATGDAKFVVNPPRRAERVIDNIKGTFRKHLTIVEGDDGVIRIYNSREEDHLAVYTSTDGVHFDRPDQGRGEINGHRNIVIPDMVGGLGNPFWDPQGQPDERWKYFTDYQRRGIYLYTSADGYDWTAAAQHHLALPLRHPEQHLLRRSAAGLHGLPPVRHLPHARRQHAAQFGGHRAQGPARDPAVYAPLAAGVPRSPRRVSAPRSTALVGGQRSADAGRLRHGVSAPLRPDPRGPGGRGLLPHQGDEVPLCPGHLPRLPGGLLPHTRTTGRRRARSWAWKSAAWARARSNPRSR